VSEADREEFTQWLRESQLHVAELLHVAHVHDALERFKLWDEIPLETPAEGDNVNVLPAPTGDRGARKWGWGTAGLIATAACVIAIGLGWLTLYSGTKTLETDRAERREVVLKDGSVLSLDPETQMQISFGRHQRAVTLTRGRALFHVAKDPTRPFIVSTGDTQVRVVGTTFGVERQDQNTIVTVSEGKVAVVPTSQPQSADAQPLIANQQITVRKSGVATSVREVDSSRALAWSQGRLIFDSAPLEEVAKEFNHYNRMQLRIVSSELAQRTVSGVFRASDPQTLIDFISAGARVVVTRKGDEEIVISPAP
jgi:transmembrane sensor